MDSEMVGVMRRERRWVFSSLVIALVGVSRGGGRKRGEDGLVGGFAPVFVDALFQRYYREPADFEGEGAVEEHVLFLLARMNRELLAPTRVPT